MPVSTRMCVVRAALLAGVASLPGALPAMAADDVVDFYSTLTNGGLAGALDTPGDTLAVTPDGTIDIDSATGTFANGILTSAADTTATNDGVINVTNTAATGSSGAAGMSDDGSLAATTLVNKGRVTVTTHSADDLSIAGGISSTGSDSIVTNTGNVLVSASAGATGAAGAFGLSGEGDDAVVTNSGLVEVTASGGVFPQAYGIFGAANRVSLGNSGAIDVTVTDTPGGGSAYGMLNPNAVDVYMESTGTIETFVDVAGPAEAYGLANTNGEARNSGSIFTEAHGGSGTSRIWGIFADGGGRAGNAGTITGILTSGDDASAFGISAHGGGNEAINTGAIDLTVTANDSTGAYGIHLRDADSTGFNSGTIDLSVKGGRGEGYGFYREDGGTLTNTGRISVFVDVEQNGSAGGVFDVSGERAFFNSGDILAVALAGGSASGYGIYSYDSPTSTIVNEGSFEVRATGGSGASARGIYSYSETGSVRNSGRITVGAWRGDTPVDGYAVYVDGADVDLYLDAPSYLGGIISVTDYATNTTTITTGASHAILWDLTNLDNAALTVEDAVVPAFSDTGDWATATQIATFDPTLFAGRVSALADRTGALGSVMRGRLDARCAAGEVLSRDADDPPACDPADGHEIWATAFGRTMDHAGSDVAVDHDTEIHGAAAGIDSARGEDLALGAMIGYAVEAFHAQSTWSTSYDNESEGLFAAAYARMAFGQANLDLEVSGGSLRHTDRRFVNDNLAQDETGFYDGEAWRFADYDSAWASIAASLAFAFDAGDWTASPRVGGRYAAEWTAAYAESGGDAGAEVGAYLAGVGEGFVEVALRRQVNGHVAFTGRGGIRARTMAGDSAVPVSLLAETHQLPVAIDDLLTAYLGGVLDITLGDAGSLQLAGNAFAGRGSAGYEASATGAIHF